MKGIPAVLSLVMVVSALATTPREVLAGEFERIEGDTLVRLVQDESAARRDRLGFADLERLPSVLSDARSAFLLVKTGQGHYAKLLVTPGLRKAPGETGEAVPVVVVDRFETLEPGKSGSRLAKGTGLILFEGFLLDLDSGQIVPPGQGGDLTFRKPEGETSPVLKAEGAAALYTLNQPIAEKLPAVAGPTPGKAIVTGDFSGRYQLQADGRWSGLLELQVGQDRHVTGRFRSEALGTSYPVIGQIPAESPQKIEFTIKFPRTEQEYQGYLWTEGKNVLSGSFVMTDRTFGFVAVREGAVLSPPK